MIVKVKISEFLDFLVYIIANASEREDNKDELVKYFRLGALRKYKLDNRQFLMRYKLLIKSLNNEKLTQLMIVPDSEDIKAPQIPSIIKRLLKKLVGSAREDIQADYLKMLLKERDEIENNVVLRNLKG